MNLSVVIVNNGLEALSILNTIEFDLILMDIQMPEMDGFQATREIREQVKFKNLPIIAMTAHAMSGDKEKCLSVGMNDHIAKPIELEQLIPVLSKWLDKNINLLPQFNLSPDNTTEESLFRLPDIIPGIIQTEGLKKIHGNHRLYHKLLKQFYKDHKETANTIRKCLNEQELLSAQHLAHTIKGVAGNLGAIDLYETATNLEQSLIETSDYKTPLPLFINAFEIIMQGLAELFAVEISAPLDVDYKSANSAEINVSIQQLKTCLEKHSFKSSDCLPVLSKALANSHAEIFQQLEVNVEHFLFDSALECLEQLNLKINSTSNHDQ